MNSLARGLRIRTTAWVAALLAIAVYANAPANGFTYDDVVLIQADSGIHGIGAVPRLFTRNYWSSDPALALYRPLTTASFALDWSISGGDPAWFHVVNVFWHGLATALATLLLGVLFGNPAALSGGALFALHPVHVEAVSNVVGRAELLAAVAVFAAGLAWIRMTGWRRIAAAGACYGLGLLAKESVVVLPALLALIDVAAARLTPGRVREYVRRESSAAGVLLVIALLYLLLRNLVLGGLVPTRVDPALEIATGTVPRIATALQAWPHVLRLLLFPRVLLADYGPGVIMPVPPTTPAMWLGLVIVIAIVGWGLLAWHLGRGRTAMLLLWVPVALLPVSNLLVPIGVIVAERLLYIPSFAVAAAGGLVAGHAFRARAAVRHVTAILLLVVGAAAAMRTWTRTGEWRTTEHLFAAQLMSRPDNFRTHWYRARSLRAVGDHDGALAAYRKALELWPFRRGLVLEATQYEVVRGQLPRARELARFAASRWPDDIGAQRLHAATSLDLGDTLTARAAARAGLAIDSTDELLVRMMTTLDSAASPPESRSAPVPKQNQ